VSAGGHDPDVEGAAPESRGVPAVENQEQERQLRPACQSAVQVGGQIEFCCAGGWVDGILLCRWVGRWNYAVQVGG